MFPHNLIIPQVGLVQQIAVKLNNFSYLLYKRFYEHFHPHQNIL